VSIGSIFPDEFVTISEEEYSIALSGRSAEEPGILAFCEPYLSFTANDVIGGAPAMPANYEPI
jgi:hypothetical protein